jgi:hypothetical protein
MKQKISVTTGSGNLTYGANSGAEQPHFPFTGKPDINVGSDIAEVTARETNWYAQKFVENTPNLKLKSRPHHYAGIENYIIIKHSQYLSLELQQCIQWCNCFNDDFIICRR